jgi:hypothetical protein
LKASLLVLPITLLLGCSSSDGESIGRFLGKVAGAMTAESEDADPIARAFAESYQNAASARAARVKPPYAPVNGDGLQELQQLQQQLAASQPVQQ